MMHKMFEANTRVCFQHRTATVFPAGPDKVTLLFDEGSDSVVSKSTLLQALSNHQIQVIEDTAPAANEAFILDEKKHADVIRKAAYINVAKRVPNHRNQKVLESVIRRVKQQIGDLNPPAWSTLYKWIRKHDQQGKDSDPLQTQSPAKRKQDKRVPESVEILIEECIDDVYLQPNERYVWPAYEQFKKRLKSVYATDKKDPFKSTFYNRVNALCVIETTRKQEGKMAARTMMRTAIQEMRANTILEQVQMDAVHLNIPLYDDEGNFLGYPINHFSIDVHSRAVMGFSVELGGESSAGVIECLQNVVRFKQHEEHSYTKNPWVMYGKPLEISHDGGAAYTSQTVSGFLASLGIIGQTNDVGQPWKKAMIERFNRTLRDQFASRFKSYLGKRGDGRDSSYAKDYGEKVTLEKYKKLLTYYIVDDYNQSAHTALLDRTPNNVWIEQAEIATPMEPASLPYAMRLKGNWLPPVTYDPTSGMRINNVYYNSKELHKYYLREQTPSRSVKVKLDVLYNPSNIYDVTVMIGKKLIVVSRYKSDFPVHVGMSLAEHKAKRKARLEAARKENSKEDKHVPVADVISKELKDAIHASHQSDTSTAKTRPQMPIEQTNKAIAAVSAAQQHDMEVEEPYTDNETEKDELQSEEPIDALKLIMELHIDQKGDNEHD